MRDQERSQITPEGARNLIWLLAGSLYLGNTRLAESLWMKREIHSTESHLANSHQGVMENQGNCHGADKTTGFPGKAHRIIVRKNLPEGGRDGQGEIPAGTLSKEGMKNCSFPPPLIPVQ